ncbi:MAG: 3-hydroxyacyl-CoA dehydrogenase NAD-binding domain-containing protein, partial [Planctomycetes bacterium]|nr:3-hydroxyacyl-CoA dehydrogenase NAD-binding domain-containing protein [Planctomycetota bacterium]
GFPRALEAGLAREAALCGPLVAGDITRNLIAVFQASERARRLTVEARDGDGSLAREPFAAVLGAGVMGAGIGALLLQNGIETRMRDLDGSALARGLSEISKQLARHAAQRRYSRAETEAMYSRLTHTTALVGFGRSDVVLEAIVEKLAVKRRALAEMEGLIPAGAIFATNTSALRVTEIQREARHPERVIGVHFFNPVHRMPLVEVIPGERTASWAVARAVALAQRLGKFPVVVKDGPGFLVNRLLLPYLDSACRLLLRGVPGPRIDAAAVAYGLPMGPLRLLDEVGIDIAVEVGATLHAAFGERAAPAPVLAELAGAGRLGRKCGIGFYRHPQRGNPVWDFVPPAGMAVTAAPPANDGELADYLLDRMVDEAARCLEEEIILTPAEVDLALVMGIGFPAFRGGLLRAADRGGLGAVVARLSARATAGEATSASPLLAKLAAESRGFESLAPRRTERAPAVAAIQI